VPARVPALVALVTVAVFARALPYPLQLRWDDARFIVDNAFVRTPSWAAFVAIWSGPQLEAYHPLHLLSYWLDVPWSGALPSLVHAVSLALWIGAALVLRAALLALGLSEGAAAIAVLACVLHPVQVEAVSWASGRKDVLALLFASLCLLCHLGSRHALDRRAWLARAAYLAGALAKTTVLPLPLVLLLADVLVRRQPLRRALKAQLPSLVLGALLGALVLVIWREAEMVRPEGERTGELLPRMVATFGHQLLTALWPARVAPMYSTTAMASPPGYAWLLLLLFALLLAGLWRAARRGGPNAARAAFGLGAFALLLAPVSNTVPMYFSYQDRYLSLPLLGLAIALGATWDALPRGGLRVLPAVLVGMLALRCVQYQGEWQSESRLWGHAASTQPDAYYAWLKLGEVRREAGDLEGSIRAYRQLVQLDVGRKTGYAALFLAAALRDERRRGIAPSQAEAYAARLYKNLDNADALRDLAAQLLAAGYLRALEVPLARSLVLQPIDDRVLEHAAETQFEAGRPTIALLYAHRMRAPTKRPDLRAVIERAERALDHIPRVAD
jgi:protein O-mannosyl-transferase